MTNRAAAAKLRNDPAGIGTEAGMETKGGIDGLPKVMFRIEGLSCANCAAKFEKNVRELPHVEEAQVNFGASKLILYGKASVKELERAGVFDGLRVVPETDGREPERTPFLRRSSTWTTLAAATLLLAGWLLAGRSDTAANAAYALAIVAGGYKLFWRGLRSLVRFDFTMNALMTIAIAGAAAIGEWSEGATVVLLFAISEALEAYSMERARSSLRGLMRLAPKEAAVRRGDTEHIVRAEDVRIGDTLVVRPGQSIALDGIVTGGGSAVSQAAITGESLPVMKRPGDEVFAGTWNGDGFLEIEVTKVAADTTLARIIHLVEEAQAEKAPVQAFVDRFAKWYTPAVLLLAIIVAVIPPLFAGDWGGWLYRALALLVVGCPCALVISTPIAVVTAIGNAARSGVLIKGGVHLEQLGKLTAAAFDKTGTLTSGAPEVTDVVPLGAAGERELLQVAAALERRADHPLAAAVIRKALAAGIEPSGEVTEFVSVTGQGVRGNVQGVPYVLGKPSFVEAAAKTALHADIRREIEILRRQGKTVLALSGEHGIVGLIGLADEVRPDAKQAVAELRKLGLGRLVMLTGDHRQAAEPIARELELDGVQAELLPERKLQAVRQLSEREAVAMIGDGVNDAPALAAATVGVAMGAAGTEAALETADVVIMNDDLTKLPYAIRLGRKAHGVIRQNIAAALGLKLLAIILIVPDWLTLWLAIVADMGAMLLVTLNSLRLLRVRR